MSTARWSIITPTPVALGTTVQLAAGEYFCIKDLQGTAAAKNGIYKADAPMGLYINQTHQEDLVGITKIADTAAPLTWVPNKAYMVGDQVTVGAVPAAFSLLYTSVINNNIQEVFNPDWDVKTALPDVMGLYTLPHGPKRNLDQVPKMAGQQYYATDTHELCIWNNQIKDWMCVGGWTIIRKYDPSEKYIAGDVVSGFMLARHPGTGAPIEGWGIFRFDDTEYDAWKEILPYRLRDGGPSVTLNKGEYLYIDPAETNAVVKSYAGIYLAKVSLAVRIDSANDAFLTDFDGHLSHGDLVRQTVPADVIAPFKPGHTYMEGDGVIPATVTNYSRFYRCQTDNHWGGKTFNFAEKVKQWVWLADLQDGITYPARMPAYIYFGTRPFPTESGYVGDAYSDDALDSTVFIDVTNFHTYKYVKGQGYVYLNVEMPYIRKIDFAGTPDATTKHDAFSITQEKRNKEFETGNITALTVRSKDTRFRLPSTTTPAGSPKTGDNVLVEPVLEMKYIEGESIEYEVIETADTGNELKETWKTRIDDQTLKDHERSLFGINGVVIKRKDGTSATIGLQTPTYVSELGITGSANLKDDQVLIRWKTIDAAYKTIIRDVLLRAKDSMGRLHLDHEGSTDVTAVNLRLQFPYIEDQQFVETAKGYDLITTFISGDEPAVRSTYTMHIINGDDFKILMKPGTDPSKEAEIHFRLDLTSNKEAQFVGTNEGADFKIKTEVNDPATGVSTVTEHTTHLRESDGIVLNHSVKDAKEDNLDFELNMNVVEHQQITALPLGEGVHIETQLASYEHGVRTPDPWVFEVQHGAGIYLAYLEDMQTQEQAVIVRLDMTVVAVWTMTTKVETITDAVYGLPDYTRNYIEIEKRSVVYDKLTGRMTEGTVKQTVGSSEAIHVAEEGAFGYKFENNLPDIDFTALKLTPAPLDVAMTKCRIVLDVRSSDKIAVNQLWLETYLGKTLVANQEHDFGGTENINDPTILAMFGSASKLDIPVVFVDDLGYTKSFGVLRMTKGTAGNAWTMTLILSDKLEGPNDAYQTQVENPRYMMPDPDKRIPDPVASGSVGGSAHYTQDQQTGIWSSDDEVQYPLLNDPAHYSVASNGKWFTDDDVNYPLVPDPAEQPTMQNPIDPEDPIRYTARINYGIPVVGYVTASGGASDPTQVITKQGFGHDDIIQNLVIEQPVSDVLVITKNTVRPFDPVPSEKETDTTITTDGQVTIDCDATDPDHMKVVVAIDPNLTYTRVF